MDVAQPPPTVPLEALPLPALLIGADGVVLARNRRSDAVVPADAPRTGVGVTALLPDEPGLHERLLAAAAEGAALRVHARRPDRVPVPANALVSRTDGVGTLLVVLEEVRDAQLVGEAQRWLDVAFSTAPIGMAVFDTDGRYVRVNPALCRMLDRSPDELLGRRDQETTHPDDRERDVEAAWRVLEGELDSWQTEKRFLTPGGDVIWAIANLVVLRDEDGRPLCWVGQFQDITARKFSEQQLRHLAEHDDLTGVANRRRLLRELRRLLRRSPLPGARGREGGALVLLDLDGFKEVNDTDGHDAGDRVLVAVARALAASIRSTDVVGRLGGDEFAVLLPGADETAAARIAASLVHAIEQATTGRVGASCGIALVEPGQASAEDVLLAADRSMYAVKAARRDAGRAAHRAGGGAPR